MKFRLSVIGFFFVVAVLAVQLCAQLTGDTVTVPSFLKKEKNVIEFNDADWSALFDGMVRLQNDTDTVPRVVAMVISAIRMFRQGFSPRLSDYRCSEGSGMRGVGWSFL